MGGAVARPGGLQAFAKQAGKALVQAVKHIDRGGVVIGSSTFPLPVPQHKTEIEEPALDRRLARLDCRDGAIGKGDRRKAWRRGQTFLRAGIGFDENSGLH
jgi:hypothetical protein